MINHLIEIRRRTLYILIYFVIFFGLFFFISDNLFAILIRPLLDSLPNNDGLIATDITTPLFTPINIAANCSLIITSPFALLHIWRYIFPALYSGEAYKLRTTLIACLLFIIGIVFCYFLVLPFIFEVIVHVVPDNVHLLPDMAYTVNFIIRMMLIFGFCFQLPLVAIVLVQFDLITHALLKSFRPYFIVLAFIIGMLLTPPDVFSQIMLAIPLILLYELGIYIAGLIKPELSN